MSYRGQGIAKEESKHTRGRSPGTSKQNSKAALKSSTGSRGSCANCQRYEKDFYSSESKALQLGLELLKLRRQVRGSLRFLPQETAAAEPSSSALHVEDQHFLPHSQPESFSLTGQGLSQATHYVPGTGGDVSEEKWHRADELMAELTHLMEGLETPNAPQSVNNTHLRGRSSPGRSQNASVQRQR